MHMGGLCGCVPCKLKPLFTNSCSTRNQCQIFWSAAERPLWANPPIFSSASALDNVYHWLQFVVSYCQSNQGCLFWQQCWLIVSLSSLHLCQVQDGFWLIALMRHTKCQTHETDACYWHKRWIRVQLFMLLIKLKSSFSSLPTGVLSVNISATAAAVCDE